MNELMLLGFGDGGWGLMLLEGAGITVAVTGTALLIGAIIGSVVAWLKLSSHALSRAIGESYTVVFRGVPELLIIYVFYFGGSSILTTVAHWAGQDGFVGIPPFIAGALGVGVICGAYQAEVFRGAFNAIPRGQVEAAVAMGMGPLLRFRRIVAPQVLRFALPGLGNVLQLSFKDSALVSVTGLAEIMRRTDVAARTTREYFLFYLAGVALYLILTAITTRAFNTAEKRLDAAYGARPEEA
ncbi:ABC transporter permease [Rhizobium binxianense]|uniref:ABC transporter permease n=1 Tax=Rhizobium binxianense TaxID=3024242 RepID=UPI0023625CDD|nr:ABC transporter permease subunit [Rhizobium sp. MJ37]MDC9837819.1 ABC transporter permease subunit [Rhizobium sp. MJ37]